METQLLPKPHLNIGISFLGKRIPDFRLLRIVRHPIYGHLILTLQNKQCSQD